MRALILEDGLSRQALAGARGLAAAGWEVGIGSSLARGVAACSRATSHDHRVPGPERDLDGFVAAVNRAIAEVGYDLVFGARDVEVLALSSRRDEIGAHVPHPPHEHVTRALDKYELAGAARRAGVTAPATVPAGARALEESSYPVMVKARLHATLDGAARPPRLESSVAGTQAEAAAAVRAIETAGGEAVLQEAVDGPLMELAIVADRQGQIVAAVQQTVQRTSTREGGVAVRATTVAIDEDLMESVGKLVTELGWWGLTELQFIVPESGDAHLIDFNGRFYGSMALAIGAGANLPAIWARLASGQPAAPAAPARLGVRYQWVSGDVRRCFAEDRGDRARTLLDTARWSSGAVKSVLAARDPLPGLRHAALDGREFLARRLHDRGA